MPAGPPRRAIRTRLTLWYGGAFLVLGLVLMGINYVVVDAALPSSGEGAVEQAVARRLGVEPSEGRGRRPLPPPARGTLAVGDVIDQTAAAVKQSTLREVVLYSGIGLGAAGVASLFLGWLLAGRLLRPLSAITRAARRISNENLHERVALQGPNDELRELADQFDTMLGRLERAFEAQREFVANASHELRTPLAIIRTELDVTLGRTQPPGAGDLTELRCVIDDAVTRAEALTQGLLALAQAESGLSAVARVDLAALLRQAIASHAPAAFAAGLRVTQRYAPGSLEGDPILLERLADNLVANAVRHNREGGWIDVQLARQGASWRLRVANSGAAVPSERVATLFERFTRLDGSRSRETGGFGLGLSIVRSVVEAHGGGVGAQPEPGGGLRVWADLPARRSQRGSARAVRPLAVRAGAAVG